MSNQPLGYSNVWGRCGVGRVHGLAWLAIGLALAEVGIFGVGLRGASPPSLAGFLCGLGAAVAGLAALVRINRPNSGRTGRPLAAAAIVVGLAAGLMFMRQIKVWRAGQEEKEIRNTTELAQLTVAYTQRNGQAPEKLGDLWADVHEPELFISPFSYQTEKQWEERMDPTGKKDWPGMINAQGDYVPAAQGITREMLQGNGTMMDKIIAVWGKDTTHDGDRVVAFMDGHGGYVKGDDLESVAEASNAARRKLGLKAIELDEPVETAASRP